MRQQQLDLQSRRLHAFPDQKLGATLNDFQDRHAASLIPKREAKSPKLRRRQWNCLYSRLRHAADTPIFDV